MPRNSSSQCIYGVRVYPNRFFFPVDLSGLLRLSGHGVIPRVTMTRFFDHLEVHTDGSAVLRNGWPAVPISAGWGAIFFAVREDGSRRILGALWGPFDVCETSRYFLGAIRPMIPVAELTAITVVIMLLRQAHFGGQSLGALAVCTLWASCCWGMAQQRSASL